MTRLEPFPGRRAGAHALGVAGIPDSADALFAQLIIWARRESQRPAVRPPARGEQQPARRGAVVHGGRYLVILVTGVKPPGDDPRRRAASTSRTASRSGRPGPRATRLRGTSHSSTSIGCRVRQLRATSWPIEVREAVVGEEDDVGVRRALQRGQRAARPRRAEMLASPRPPASVVAAVQQPSIARRRRSAVTLPPSGKIGTASRSPRPRSSPRSRPRCRRRAGRRTGSGAALPITSISGSTERSCMTIRGRRPWRRSRWSSTSSESPSPEWMLSTTSGRSDASAASACSDPWTSRARARPAAPSATPPTNQRRIA